MITKAMPITQLSPDDNTHYWVGYYDKQPWSQNNSSILTHQANFIDHYPEPHEHCQVGTITDGEFRPAATTKAWNWQQGAHLRWSSLPGQETLMFNDLDDEGNPISRWVTKEGTQLHAINSHIYAVTPGLPGANPQYGLTLDFGRLTRLRPEYGYPALKDKNESTPAPDDEGLWKVDLQTQSVFLSSR